jgi:hypothetical protein
VNVFVPEEHDLFIQIQVINVYVSMLLFCIVTPCGLSEYQRLKEHTASIFIYEAGFSETLESTYKPASHNNPEYQLDILNRCFCVQITVFWESQFVCILLVRVVGFMTLDSLARY